MTLHYEQSKIYIDISTKKATSMEGLVKCPTKTLLSSVAHSYKNRQKTVLSFKLSASMLLFLCIISSGAEAANWYVRPNGSTYGTGTGKDWTNAMSGFSGITWSAVACGDTIWVAGGTYTQDLIPQKNCTSGSPLSILRARSDATASTSAAGWNSNFDSTVHQSRSGVKFNGAYNYIKVSGRTTASGGGYGWWIDFNNGRTGATSGIGIDFPNGSNASYNLVEYMELEGPGAKVTYSSDGRGIDATPFSSATGNIFSHLKIHDWESGVYNAGIANSTYEWLDEYDLNAANSSAFHPNGIFINGSPGGIVRYSRFHKGPAGYNTGEGVFFENGGGASNWQIYGNIFYDMPEAYTKAIEVIAAVPNLKIFNNTFVNTASTLYLQNSGCAGGGEEYRNNLFYNAGTGYKCGSTSNNVYSTVSTVFANYAAKDFHITSTVATNYPRNAGTNLASIFTVDSDSTQFGSDGSWDVGSYEFGSATPALQSLAPPSRLSVSP